MVCFDISRTTRSCHYPLTRLVILVTLNELLPAAERGMNKIVHAPFACLPY